MSTIENQTKTSETQSEDEVTSPENILSVRNLVKFFPITSGILSRVVGHVHAVDDVSFDVPRPKTIGVVGESGCGKTTLGRTILRLGEPTSGDVFFEGENIAKISLRQYRKYRREMQIVFQDPYASLNPRMMVKNTLREPLLVHKTLKKRQINNYILRVMREVGLDLEHLNRFPHEFSGGQRQRICIARALMLNPNFLVLDEPTASVDVSVQARVLNLLKRLQKLRNLTYMFISHDLSVVTHMSDTVLVMYLGKILEIGPKRIFTLKSSEVHPYTLALGSALPIPDPFYEKKQIILRGDVPNPANPPPGCRFHTRCPEARQVCTEKIPELKKTGESHHIACHFRE